MLIRIRRAGHVGATLGAFDLVLWALYLPALALLAFYLWGYFAHAWNVVRFPYELDYGEVPELNRAMLLALGRPIYTDWSTPPFQMANYTPLFPLLAAVGVKLFGVQFFTGRLLAWLCTLASGALVGVIAWAYGAGRRGTVIAASLWFVGYPVWNWGAFQRVDSLAVALELAGVAVFAVGWQRRHRVGAIWLTVPLFVLAAYSRQTVVAGAFACYVTLLVRRPKLALRAVGAYAGIGLALFGLLMAVTGGQFWQHIVKGNVNRWYWQTVMNHWNVLWLHFHWVFAFALVALFAALVRRRPAVPYLYCLAAGATALTIGKVGSNVNYLLQLWAALSLLVGLAIGALDRAAWRGWLLATGRRAGEGLALRVGAVLLAVLPALWLLVGLQQAYHVPYSAQGRTVTVHSPARLLDQLGVPTWPLWRLDPYHIAPKQLATAYRGHYLEMPDQNDWRTSALAHAFVADTPGPVLSEDMAFTVTTGKELYLQPFEFTQLAVQGEWNEAPVIQAINQQQFALVVLRWPLAQNPTWHAERLNLPVVQALRQHYQLARTYGTYYIYAPKG